MSTNLSFDDLLDVSANDVESKSRGSYEMYNPDSEKGKNGVYKAVIRFVPWYKEKEKTLVKKWSAWLVDPATEEGRAVDCPSTIGKPSPLHQMWKKYKDSDNPQEKAIADRFSRSMKCVVPIQIIKDDNNPELEGKILLWKFGKKIWDKVEAEMKEGSLDSESGGVAPWHLLNGRRFKISVKKVGKWNNYDDCQFAGDAWPKLIVDGEEIDLTTASQEDRSRVVKFLEQNTPDLEKHMFKEWDEETQEFVNRVIKNSINPAGHISSEIRSGSSGRRVESKDIDDVLQEDISTSSSSSAATLDDVADIDDSDPLADF